MTKVVVAGSLNVDVSFSVSAFPCPGEDKPVRGSWRGVGGKALNQATAAHRAGAVVCLVGAVGDDSYGTEVTGFLREEGIETTFCQVIAGVPTGLALILIEPNARNTILFEPGAVRHLRWPRSLTVRPGDIVLSHAEVPAGVLSAAFESGRRVGTFNIMSGMRIDQVDEVSPLLDLLIVNQLEFETLVQQPVPIRVLIEEDLRPVAEQSGLESVTLVVTLGEMGARYFNSSGSSCYFPAPKVDAVDTTAAGDIFCGALSAELSDGRNLLDAIRFGVVSGSLAVKRRGAASSAPKRNEILSFRA